MKGPDTKFPDGHPASGKGADGTPHVKKGRK